MFFRLLDEFGDGLGLAQAIPSVSTQFLTSMALEARLQQAMEVLKYSWCYVSDVVT